MSQVPADFSTVDMKITVTGLKTLGSRMLCRQKKKPRLRRMNQSDVFRVEGRALTTLQEFTTSTNPELVSRTNCAGFWLRLVACTIDAFIAPILAILVLFILLIPLCVAGAITGASHSHIAEGVYQCYGAGVAVLVCLSDLIYFAAFESSPLQATPGKLTLGLIVTDSRGQRLTFWRALARNFLKVVSQLTLYIGYILAGLTDQKQALHDMMSGCLVVRKLP